MTVDTVSHNELLPARGQVLLPVDTQSAQTAMEEYLAITRAVLKDDDYQQVGRGRFVKRSGLQKLANFYTVSTQIVSETTDRDDDGHLLRHRAIVRATHPTGRYAEGDGACSVEEERFKSAGGRGKLEHDLPATAVTRATNRAISNLVGFGQISAEEASATDAGGDVDGPKASPPSWAAPTGDVGKVANTLVGLFEMTGVEDAGARTTAIGQAIFDRCDNTLPQCVAYAIDLVYDAMRPAGTDNAPVGAASDPAEPTGGPDPTTDPGAPATTQEGTS
jgi:hypothetical protein